MNEEDFLSKLSPEQAETLAQGMKAEELLKSPLYQMLLDVMETECKIALAEVEKNCLTVEPEQHQRLCIKWKAKGEMFEAVQRRLNQSVADKDVILSDLNHKQGESHARRDPRTRNY